jgi:hypothetical protein
MPLKYSRALPVPLSASGGSSPSLGSLGGMSPVPGASGGTSALPGGSTSTSGGAVSVGVVASLPRSPTCGGTSPVGRSVGTLTWSAWPWGLPLDVGRPRRDVPRRGIRWNVAPHHSTACSRGVGRRDDIGRWGGIGRGGHAFRRDLGLERGGARHGAACLPRYDATSYTQKPLRPLGQIPLRRLGLSEEGRVLVPSGGLGVQGVRVAVLCTVQSVVEHSDEVVVLVAGTGGPLYRSPFFSSFLLRLPTTSGAPAPGVA